MVEINATEIAGVAAFGMAAVSTGLAAQRIGQSRRTLLIVAALYAMMAIDVVVGLRHGLAAAAGRELGWLGEYGQRRPLQAMAVLAVAMVIVIGGWLFARRQVRWLRPPLAVVTASLALFAIETISLHQIDAILYYRVGVFMVIGLLWLVLGVLAVETAHRVPGTSHA